MEISSHLTITNMHYYIINTNNITPEMRELTHSKEPETWGDLECLKFKEPIECEYEFYTEDGIEIRNWLYANNLITNSE